jgi:hypothetical protein
MKDTIHIPGHSAPFARRFLQEVPGFAEDFRGLSDTVDSVPAGLVFAAAARFCRLGGKNVLAATAAVIEDAANTEDDELHNYIVTEIFEDWDDAEPDTKARLLEALGPEGRKLYERWLMA